MAEKKEKKQDGVGEKKTKRKKSTSANTRKNQKKGKKRDPALPIEISFISWLVGLVGSFVAPFCVHTFFVLGT